MYFDNSSCTAGNGSVSGPCPSPVFKTFRGPAPTKLYLPSCSDAALSKRKDNFDFDFAVIFKYAAEGVIRSEDICAYTGTRFGFTFVAASSVGVVGVLRICCTVSRLGSRLMSDYTDESVPNSANEFAALLCLQNSLWNSAP